MTLHVHVHGNVSSLYSTGRSSHDVSKGLERTSLQQFFSLCAFSSPFSCHKTGTSSTCMERLQTGSLSNIYVGLSIESMHFMMSSTLYRVHWSKIHYTESRSPLSFDQLHPAAQSPIRSTRFLQVPYLRSRVFFFFFFIGNTALQRDMWRQTQDKTQGM